MGFPCIVLLNCEHLFLYALLVRFQNDFPGFLVSSAFVAIQIQVITITQLFSIYLNYFISS